MSEQEANDALERLCNLLRMEARAFGLRFGLQPVQMEALKYLTQCNRYSDTPQAVGEYLGLTKGTVSQSLKALEQKGLLTKKPDKQDKRVIHLTPTLKGNNLTKKATQTKGLGRALAITNSITDTELTQMLRSVLRGLQQVNGRKAFGACHTCRFNEQHPEGSVCGLTHEPLSAQDVQLICREHQYPQ
ncbi:MAG: MarR family winged helix-turn-helix transcriptional regulator [Nitrospirota bacterium]|nr:MarR family winged helix-turn-helix transcriptional regulator [Nitrospirota bacterium]